MTEKQTLARHDDEAATTGRARCLVEQGRSSWTSFMIVRSGVVVVLRSDEDGGESEQSRARPG